MRTRSITALLAGALALVPTIAAGLEYDGRLGLGYDRVESWNNTQHDVVPRLRLDGNIGARGFLVDQGVVDWNARVGYDELRSTYGSTTDKASGLTYSAGVGVLQTRASKLRVGATANRTVTDFATDSDVTRTTGTSTYESYSVNAASALPDLPGVTSAFTYRDVLSSGFGRSRTRETAKLLELGSQFGQRGLDAKLDYSLQWDEGTLSPVNYTTQRFGMSAAMTPSDKTFSGFTASYFTRDPSASAPANPRYENTLVDGHFGWGDPRGSRAWGQYRYSQAIVSDPSILKREMLVNGLSANLAQRTSSEWEFVESASGSYSQTRLGVDQTTAAGQALGLTVNWTRPSI